LRDASLQIESRKTAQAQNLDPPLSHLAELESQAKAAHRGGWKKEAQSSPLTR
jgi:hypothetical protein